MTSLAVPVPTQVSTSRTMRAAVLAAPRRFELVEARLPRPGARQALVRLEGCGVCASNVAPWEGKPWFAYPMAPGALGHEGWGRVEEVGAEVEKFAPGDRVAMLSAHAYAEYDVADEGSLLRLPATLDGAPFPGEPLGCAMNIFFRSQIRREDVVAIVGIGFLGALLTQLAHAAGARVIAVARRPFAGKVARAMGAAQTFAMGDHSAAIDEVSAQTGGAFCDVVIEAAGRQETLDLAAQLTRERGRLVIAGYHQDGPRQVNMQLWNWRGLDVINAHERDPRVYLEGMRRAAVAVESARLTPQPLYSHQFSLGELNAALTMNVERPEGFMKALIAL